MKNIFIIGAGKSTPSLIKYLSENSVKEGWQITVGDISLECVEKRIAGLANTHPIQFDITNDIQRVREINKADLVISMLPASLHLQVAKDCIALKKHMVTASYISDEMKALEEEAIQAGVVLMNEIGVDPGIDHLSAMSVIDRIKSKGGEMTSFETFTGGLLAPESYKDNPWKYKFTWNPRNVVIAGQGTAVKFIQEGKYKYIPYHKVFKRTEIIHIPDYGKFEGYANRDSLKYRQVYGLEDIKTIYRGTLRRPGFCRAWNVFVQIGATDDSYYIENIENMTYRDFINLFLAYNPHDTVELKLMHYMKLDQDNDIMDKLAWLGVFENTKIGLKRATPAQILQHILEQKWSMEKKDKDMIAMWHKFDYVLDNVVRQIQSSMVVIGDDNIYTAMAKTVGYPVAITTKMILNGTISKPGVHIPIEKEMYEPILNELQKFGIRFTETQMNEIT